MRKNYFAKKFVAYSMAFAVAFSTLTVSPVFVKEAKAVTFTQVLKSGGGSSLSNGKFAADADRYIMNSLTKDTATDIEAGKEPDYTQMEEILGTTATYLYNDVTVTAIPNSTIDGTNSPKYKMTITTPDALKASKKTDLVSSIASTRDSLQLKDADVTEPATLADPVVTTVAASDKLVVLDGVQNKNVTLQGLETAASIKYTWYKLVPVSKTFDWTNKNNGTSKLTFTGYKLVVADGITTATSTKAVYKISKVTEDELGLYICVDKTNDKLVSFVNLCEKSNLGADSVKSEVFAKVGSKAKLTVETTGSKSKTFTWTKGVKTLTTPTENPNEYVIENVTEDDFGKYTCTVADGTTQKEVEIRLSQLTQDEVATANAANKATTVNTNVFDAINDARKFPSGKYTLTTSLPSGNYNYIWELTSNDGSSDITALAPISSSDKLSYNVSNKAITVALKDTIVKSAKCYAIPKSVYDNDKTIKTDLEELSKITNPVDQAAAIDTLRGHEYNRLIGNAAYVENFTFVTTAAKDTTLPTDIKTVKMGDTVTLEAPTAVENKGTAVKYVWTNTSSSHTYTVVDSTSNKLTITNVDQNDLGTINCKITYCKDGCADLAAHVKNNHTSTNEDDIYKEFNLVSESDLAVTASDVQVRKGQKAELTVNATSSLPLSYKWYKQKGDKIVLATNDAVTYISETTKPKKDFELAADATTHALKLTNVGAGNYYEATANEPYTYLCEVTDGINTVKSVVKVTEVSTFKVYENEEDVKGGVGNALDGTTPVKVSGLKDEKVTLAPVVVAASEDIEKELTYKWTKDGLAYSTDKAITVDATDATYAVTITEGTSPITINYTVKCITEKDLEKYVDTACLHVVGDKTAIYTGKEINPVKEVYYEDTTNGKYTLKAGVDYNVTLVDAINAGVSLYEVELIGNFKNLYAKYTEALKDVKLRGTFTITRADNKVEIADNTVVLGKSVQPKTVTNLGKGALTYTYYADAAETTEIAAPTKVGTYYVKATAAATMNYNEAESNVATVKVVPGKVKMLGTSRTASSVKLNWNKATGATSYRVYYKAAGAKSYKVFKNTTATSMNVTGLASATTYTFAVKAYAKTAGYSTVYATKQTTTAPAKVATPSVTAGSKKATVKFDKVARSTGYQVYMAKGNGSYKKVATTKSLSFTKTGLTKGATYKFKVRAYKTVGSNTYYGAFSSAKAVVVK